VEVADVAETVPFKRVPVNPSLASAELWEECEALLRFWKRRCFFCFVPESCPGGEVSYFIDTEHLSFALNKVKHYEQLLANRGKAPLTLEVE
jgi:hypothetical protein